MSDSIAYDHNAVAGSTWQYSVAHRMVSKDAEGDGSARFTGSDMTDEQWTEAVAAQRQIQSELRHKVCVCARACVCNVRECNAHSEPNWSSSSDCSGKRASAASFKSF